MSCSIKNDMLNQKKTLRWMKLDNAAKIYPAARTSNWSNIFRLSATLTEFVDKDILQSALDVTVHRFPSMAARLRRGTFWYYIEELKESPQIQDEYSYPLPMMSYAEVRRCAIRVIVYQKRIAIELFHSLTDGNGALIFLKSLVAQYLEQRYSISIPCENGVLNRRMNPTKEELEDSFLKHAGSISASRKENTAWHITGTPEPYGVRHLTCFHLSTREALDKAHQYNVSLTVFLCAVMMKAIENLQKEKIPEAQRRKPIRVLIPINLRKLFSSKTLRNFALYSTPEILPCLGEYQFEEICKIVQNQLNLDNTAKQMSMRIATNVNDEKLLAVRMLPLFIKNVVMKAVFCAVGERKSCLSLSNLGNVTLPSEMLPFVERMDFILGCQASAPYNCGVLSFKGDLYINFIRNTKESELEYHFFKVLQKLGLHAKVESNRKENL